MVNLIVRIKPSAKKSVIRKLNETDYLVFVKSPAREGAANAEAILLISKYFNVPKSRVCIVKGQKSRNKIVRIS